MAASPASVWRDRAATTMLHWVEAKPLVGSADEVMLGHHVKRVASGYSSRGTISCERSSGGWRCNACHHPPVNAATDSAQAPIINASGEWRKASAARQTTARTIQAEERRVGKEGRSRWSP